MFVFIMLEGLLSDLASYVGCDFQWKVGMTGWSEWQMWSLAFAVLGIIAYLLAREDMCDMDKIPGPWKDTWPLLGNVRELLTHDHHRMLLQYADTYGGILRLKVLWVNVIVVTDPTAVAKIMGPFNREGSIDKSAITYGPVNEMVEAHGCRNLLTSLADDQWKTVRKALAVSFSQGNIRKQYEVVLKKVNELIARLELMDPSMAVDVEQAALRVTLDVIGLTAFGQDFNSVSLDQPPRNHLVRVLHRCFAEVELRLINPFRSLSFIPRGVLKYGIKGAQSFEHFQEVVKTLCRRKMEQGPPAHDDFSIAAQLMRIRNKPGITDERILSEMGMLFVDAYETTGHTISWTLFCIVTNKGIQERVAEELDAAGLLRKPGSVPRELTYTDLRKLSYLNACMKESMRMYPVVSVGNGRMTNKVTKVGPYRIPPGVLVGVPLYALHNTKHNWASPSLFRPGRWLDIPVETFVYSSTDPHADRRDSVTYMPFSEGPRNCAGQSLAKMEVLTVLAKLFANFHFQLAPEMGGAIGVINRESTRLTLRTKGSQGIRMLLTQRDSMST